VTATAKRRDADNVTRTMAARDAPVIGGVAKGLDDAVYPRDVVAAAVRRRRDRARVGAGERAVAARPAEAVHATGRGEEVVAERVRQCGDGDDPTSQPAVADRAEARNAEADDTTARRRHPDPISRRVRGDTDRRVVDDGRRRLERAAQSECEEIPARAERDECFRGW